MGSHLPKNGRGQKNAILETTNKFGHKDPWFSCSFFFPKSHGFIGQLPQESRATVRATCEVCLWTTIVGRPRAAHLAVPNSVWKYGV